MLGFGKWLALVADFITKWCSMLMGSYTVPSAVIPFFGKPTRGRAALGSSHPAPQRTFAWWYCPDPQS